ncbi:MAG: hypothetical protein AUI14_09730 [Actinobacteria bacterium 13_2_20CM_2_71_6]|nr:MAG: hypothetical protein AUI14_09730 [Actinobacteria bacterium 13_2_20CM_2_71_6]
MTLQRLNTVARVGARTLLAAGFAGGMWLLTSSAAHAAHPTGTPDRAEHAVITTAGPALRLLDQVIAPTRTVPDHRRARPAAALVTGRPAPMDNSAPGASRGEPGRPRPASQAASPGPMNRPAAQVRNGADAGTGSAVLLRMLPPVLDLVRPLVDTAHRIAVPVTDLLAPLASGLRTTLAEVADQWVSVTHTATLTTAVPVGFALPSGTHHSTQVRPMAATAVPTVRAGGPGTVSGARQVPDLPEPAPVPAYPGSGSTGISTTASGSHHDAGGYAIVSAPVAGGNVADHQRLRATEVAVQPMLAEAPIFAPD